KERDDHAAAQRVVPEVARLLTPERGLCVRKRPRRPHDELPEARIPRADPSPREAQRNHDEDRVTEPFVGTLDRLELQFPGDPGSQDACSQTPVRDAHEEVPHLHGLLSPCGPSRRTEPGRAYADGNTLPPARPFR